MRRHRGNRIEVFKILKGFDRVDSNKFFKLVAQFRVKGSFIKVV